MKTILVTGGAGFIGSAVIRHLINDTNHTVINVDKLTYAGNLESLISICDNPRYRFEQVDICDSKEIARVFHQYQPDIIFCALGFFQPLCCEVLCNRNMGLF